MAPTLHHVPKTISSPIVQCLVELNLVDKVVVVNEMTFPQLKSETHHAINPMGTSPAFQDGKMILWESGAVLDYLLERFDTEHKLYPPCLHNSTPEEVATRAKYLHLKQYIIATVYPFIASLFIHTLKTADQQDIVYVQNAKEKWTTLMGPVLTKWLGAGPYFLGAKMSAVDLLAAKPLGNCNSMDLLEGFPALKALLERVRSRPSYFRAYDSLQSSKNDQSSEPNERSIVLVPRKEMEQ